MLVFQKETIVIETATAEDNSNLYAVSMEETTLQPVWLNVTESLWPTTIDVLLENN